MRSARKQASVMLQTVRIRARIHEIQTQLAEDAGADMAALIGKLEIIYRRAVGDHQFYAAARAVELQVKLVRAANRPPALIEGDMLEELQKKVDDRVKDAVSP